MRSPAALVALLAAASPAARAAEPHRIAAVQYEVRGDATARQVVTRTTKHIEAAARGGAELVIFPELHLLDAWPKKTTKKEGEVIRDIARTITPAVLKAARAASTREEIAVLVGSVPELRGGRLFNTAHLYFPGGREVVQDKIFPTAWGKKVGVTPGRTLMVFDAPWGRSVILVCYDVEFPRISDALTADSPEVFLVPSMTESEHGLFRVRWTAQARAVEHHAYVVVVGTVGQPGPGWRHFGRAMFLTPRTGDFPGVLAAGPQNEAALVFGTLDLDKLRAARKKADFHPAEDQRARSSPLGIDR